MTSAPDDLDAAVTAGAATQARRILREMDESRQDEILAHLAHRATPDYPLAVELLLEYLDETKIVYRFVRAALLDEAAVDDVTQDAFISIASAVSSFAGKSKVTTWIHRIVRNRVADHLRRERATAPLPPDDAGPAARMSSMIATRATVREALETLPDRYRIPVTLRDLDALPYAQIADSLGRNVGTVKSQVARGRALIATMISENPGTAEARENR